MSGRSQLIAAAIDAQRPSTIAAEAIEAIIEVPLAIIVSLPSDCFLCFQRLLSFESPRLTANLRFPPRRIRRMFVFKRDARDGTRLKQNHSARNLYLYRHGEATRLFFFFFLSFYSRGGTEVSLCVLPLFRGFFPVREPITCGRESAAHVPAENRIV